MECEKNMSRMGFLVCHKKTKTPFWENPERGSVKSSLQFGIEKGHWEFHTV
jgi:hypothetical protein